MEASDGSISEIVDSEIIALLGRNNVELIDNIRKYAKLLSRAAAELNNLNEMRKVILEDLQVEHRNVLNANNEKVTDKKVEALARSDSRYKIHLAKTKNKEMEVGDIGADYYALRNAYELMVEKMRDRRQQQRQP